MTRRFTAWALAALPAAACLSTPSYDPQVKVTYTEDGTGATAGATVAAPGFALHFAAGDHFHLPDMLAIDGTDVLGHDAMATCFGENDAGLQLSPSGRISGDTGTGIVKNQLQPVLRGPAAVQVKLDWTTQLCQPARMQSGTSTFTAFLDGRIVRHDTLDAGLAPAHPIDCECLDGTDPVFTVSSYWTFAQKVFGASAYIPGQVSVPDAPADISGLTRTCLDSSNGQSPAGQAPAFQVTAAWQVPMMELMDTPQNLTVHGGNGLITLGHYNAFRASNLVDLPWDNHVALFVDHSDCRTAFRHAEEYVADSPPVLMINDLPVLLSENDGIYGSDGRGMGVQLTTDRAELAGPVTSSFAVWLSFPHSVDLLRATRKGDPAATGAWYVPQQVDSRTWIVWFRDPLAGTQTIVIEPN